jgi:hypothetical protein
MELHTRIELVDTLLEEAEQKRTALDHALHARERAEQGQESTHGAVCFRSGCVTTKTCHVSAMMAFLRLPSLADRSIHY